MAAIETPERAEPTGEAPVESPDVLIVGAGFAGVGMAIRMLGEGFTDFLVIERADEVGGTWRENTYPGCACDIPSRVYSLSFAQNPEWSTGYPRQEEIWDYLRSLIDERGVRPHLRLGHELLDARWSEESGRWAVETSRGEISARVLIAGMGPLTDPAIPDLPGLDRFEGAVFHTAEWDADHDLSGERVAVIGTGASAIQVVPEIQPVVERLSVFQRTAPWIMPRVDREVGEAEKRVYRTFPFVQRALRALHYLLLESRGFPFFIAPKSFPLFERIARRHLARQVPDPELRAKLTPDYTMGCKRVLGSSTYYPALQEPNAELVTDPIAEVRERSIVTADGAERALDTIIFGTGFEIVDLPLGRVIRDREGRRLSDVWDGAPEAYKGTAVAGCPNLFTLLGPNVGLGHNSVIHMIESQISYVLDALRQMRERRLAVVEVRPGAQAAYNERIQAEFEDTVWLTGCRSWYMNEDGRVLALWPASTLRFRAELARFDLAAYEARAASPPEPVAA